MGFLSYKHAVLHDIIQKALRTRLMNPLKLLCTKTLPTSMSLRRSYADVRKFTADAILMFWQRFQCEFGSNKVKYARISTTHVCFIALTLAGPSEDVQSNKVAKIRNRYNQVPHLTQNTNGKVTNSQKTPQTRAKRSALSQQVTTKHI